MSRERRRGRGHPRGIVAIAAVALVTGCYNYSPVEMGGVAPGSDVRATLTTEKSLQLEEELGQRRSVLEGEVLDADAGSILVAVAWYRPDPRRGTEPLTQRIRLREDEILEVEARRLDRLRTGGFLGVVGTAAAFLVIRLVTGDDPGGTILPPRPDGEV